MKYRLVTKTCQDPECGQPYQVSANNATRSRFCPECQDRMETKRHRIEMRNRPRKPKDDCRPIAYVVLYCPGGDYRRGAGFTVTEVELDRRAGYLPPGTVYRHRRGACVDIVRVIGGPFHQQSLEKIKEET